VDSAIVDMCGADGCWDGGNKFNGSECRTGVATRGVSQCSTGVDMRGDLGC
jgi:hypothetical protein